MRCVRFESLREEFVASLDEVATFPDDLRNALLETPPINKSSHGDYSTYYDEELVWLIRERDRPMFEMFGYSASL